MPPRKSPPPPLDCLAPVAAAAASPASSSRVGSCCKGKEYRWGIYTCIYICKACRRQTALHLRPPAWRRTQPQQRRQPPLAASEAVIKRSTGQTHTRKEKILFARAPVLGLCFLKKRLSPGGFPRLPITAGPDHKKTVTKHAKYSIR